MSLRQLTAPTAPPASARPAEATVLRVDGDGLWFTLASEGHRYTHGPATYTPPPPGVVLTEPTPPAGTRCLAVAGEGPSGLSWWIVAFDGWPA